MGNSTVTPSIAMEAQGTSCFIPGTPVDVRIY